MARITAWVSSLMDRSRLGTISGIRFVSDPEQFVTEALTSSIALVDLNQKDAIDVVGQLVTQGHESIIAYGSHVDRDKLQAARDLGASAVLARSQLLGKPTRWLGE